MFQPGPQVRAGSCTDCATDQLQTAKTWVGQCSRKRPHCNEVLLGALERPLPQGEASSKFSSHFENSFLSFTMIAVTLFTLPWETSATHILI